MNIKPILNMIIFLMVMLLPACSSVKDIAYRIDINQGNYLDLKVIKELKLGMTKEQVRYILGSPMLIENAKPDIWYYISHNTHAHDPAVQKNLILTFGHRSQKLEKIDRSQLFPETNNK